MDIAECVRDSSNVKVCNCDVTPGYKGFAECEQSGGLKPNGTFL